MDPILSDPHMSSRRSRLRKLRLVLVGLGLALITAQTLGAMHRVGHPPAETSVCKVCAVSGQPLAMGPGTPDGSPAVAVLRETGEPVGWQGSALRAGPSARAPPAIGDPIST